MTAVMSQTVHDSSQRMFFGVRLLGVVLVVAGIIIGVGHMQIGRVLPNVAANFAVGIGILINLPELLYTSKRLRGRYKDTWPLFMISSIAFVVFLEAMGEFAWYQKFSEFDTTMHFLVPLMWVPLFFPALATGQYTKTRALILTFAHVFSVYVAWEVIEWVGDTLIGFPVLFTANEGVIDLYKDLLADTAGAMLGLLLVALFGERWVRRFMTADIHHRPLFKEKA